MNRSWLGGLTLVVLAACGEAGDGQGEDTSSVDGAASGIDTSAPAPLDATGRDPDLGTAGDDGLETDLQVDTVRDADQDATPGEELGVADAAEAPTDAAIDAVFDAEPDAYFDADIDALGAADAAQVLDAESGGADAGDAVLDANLDAELDAELDALRVFDDARVPMPDVPLAVADRGVGDAALPPPRDAAVPPPRDAALPPPRDAALPPPRDAALPPPRDAALPPPRDAALPPPRDAALPPPRDAAVPDAEVPDAEVPDAEVPDAALPDAEIPDAALPDAEIPDAALPDAEIPDVGVPPVGVFVVGTARAADERASVEVCAGASCTRTNAGRYRLGPLAGPQLVTLTFRADAHWTETAPVALPANGEVAGPADLELERGVRVDDTDPSLRRLFFDADDRRIFIDAGGRLDMVDTQDPLPWSTRTIVPDLLDLYLGISPDASGLVARRANNGALDGVIALWPLAGGGPGFSLLVEARPPSLWSDGLFVASTRVRNGIGRLQANRPGGMANTLSQRHHVGRLTTLANGRLAWMAVDTLPEPDVSRVYVGSANGLESRQIGDEPVTTDYLVNTAGSVGLLWRSAAGALIWMRSPDDNPEQVLPSVSGLVAPVILPDGSALVWVPEGPADVAPYTARRLVFNRPGVANQNLLLAAGLTASSAWTGTAGLYAVRNGVGLVYAPYTAQPAAAVLAGPAAGVTFEAVASGAGAVLLADGRAVRHTPGAPPEALGVDGLSRLVPATGGALAWRAATRQRFWLPGPGQAGAARAVATNGESEAYVVDTTFARVFARGADGWGTVQLPQGQRVTFDRDVSRVLPLDAQAALGIDAAGALRAFSGATGESYGWARGVDFVERSTDSAWVVYACDAGVFVVPTGD